MRRHERPTMLAMMKEVSVLFIGGLFFMSIAIFSVFVALLPIFATMLYFEHYNNASGFLIMIGGYMFYFVIAGYYGFLDDVMKDLEMK